MIELNTLKLNPDNPRLIKDAKFKQLVDSLSQFPKMMELRPIIVDDDNIILGGNMRFKALQELKYKEVPDSWIKKASDLTDAEKRQFIIKDNVGFGEWDWDMIANEWDTEELLNWGMELNDYDSSNHDNIDWESQFGNSINEKEGKQQITFVLNEYYIKRLKAILTPIDTNKDVALKKIIDEWQPSWLNL